MSRDDAPPSDHKFEGRLVPGPGPRGVGTIHPARRRPLRPASRALIRAVALVVGALTVPRWVMGRRADPVYAGDPEAVEPLARAVAADVRHDRGAAAFNTGDPRFDGEWAFGTQMMAAVGLAQWVRAHPAQRAEYAPVIAQAVDNLVAPRTLAFGRDAWGEDPLASLDSAHGHAYLGYVALALGALREVDPQTRHAALHDRLVGALARRLAEAPGNVIETYPGEIYPCDLASVVAALGYHQRVAHGRHAALIATMRARFENDWRAGDYLRHALGGRQGTTLGPARGATTALSAWFWRFADPAFSRRLSTRLLAGGMQSFAGFGAIVEYGPGSAGRGDIDSGPVVAGFSVSATGFALGAARIADDRVAFTALFRTAQLFGVPFDDGGRRGYITGGPIGNAILFAMMNTPGA